MLERRRYLCRIQRHAVLQPVMSADLKLCMDYAKQRCSKPWLRLITHSMWCFVSGLQIAYDTHTVYFAPCMCIEKHASLGAFVAN